MHKYIKTLLIIILTTLTTWGCQEHYPPLYSGIDGVCFYSPDLTSDKECTKEYEWAGMLNPMAPVDTCWIEVMSVGRPVAHDRAIKLRQVKAFVMDIEEIIPGIKQDTIYREVPNQAIEGVNYVSFDKVDPKLMVLPANTARHKIPIVLIKDPKDYKSLTLKIQLVETPETKIGDHHLSTYLLNIK